MSELSEIIQSLANLAARVRQLESAEIPVVGGGGGGAPDDAAYLALALDADLTAERQLVDGVDLTGVDLGPNSTYTLNHDDTAVAPGAYGSATQSPTFTVNQRGHLTAAANVAISGVPPAAHDLTGALHTHAGGTALDVAGLSAPGTVAMLTPSYSPGIASAILRTDASGVFQANVNGVFNVKAYGAIGNGIADDTAAITAAIAAAPDGSTIYFPHGTYKLTTGHFVRKSINMVGDGYGSVINWVTGGVGPLVVGFWFQSAMDANSADAPYYGPLGGVSYYRTWAGAVNAGDLAFTLADVTGLAAGTQCMLLLGADPYDATQPFLRMFNEVVSVVGMIVTFKLPVPEDITGAAHKCVTFDAIVQNIRVSDLAFTYDGTFALEEALYFDKCRNVLCENILLKRATTGIIVEACENLTLNNIYSIQLDHLGLFGTTMIAGWGFRNCRFTNLYCAGVNRVGIGLESQVRGLELENIQIAICSGVDTTVHGIYVVGGSKGVTLKDYTFHGYPGITSNALTVTETSDVSTQNAFFYDTATMSHFPLRNHTGGLLWDSIYYSQIHHYSKEFIISPSMVNVVVDLPHGIYKGVRIYISSKTGLTAFLWWPGGGDIKAYLSSGAMVDLDVGATYDQFSGIGNVDYFANNTINKYLWVSTDGSVPAGTFCVVEIEYYPTAGDDSSLSREQDNNRMALGAGTLTYATINDATITSHTHAITASADVSGAATALLKSVTGALTLGTLVVYPNVDTAVSLTVRGENLFTSDIQQWTFFNNALVAAIRYDGAAYFSSGLDVGTTTRLGIAHFAGGMVYIDRDTTNGQIMIRGVTDTNQQLIIGYNTTSDYAFFQAIKQLSGAVPLVLSPVGGGSVLIGTLTDGMTAGGSLKVAKETVCLGTMTTSGGRIRKITTYTDTCNVLTTDEVVVFNKATAFAATMPAAVVGQDFYLKNIGAGNVTLSFPGVDTVDEVDDDIILTQNDCQHLICRLANKWIKA